MTGRMEPDLWTERLTGHVAELVRRGFADAARRLIREWGGQKRYVPARPHPESPLVELLGDEAARASAEIVGGEYCEVPPRSVLSEDLKQRILRETGTTREIAARLGTTERHVRRVRNAGFGGR